MNYPLRRHAFQRVGFTYSLMREHQAFSTASQTFFQTIRSAPASREQRAERHHHQQLSFTYTYNTVNNPLRPRTGKEYTAAFQLLGHRRQCALYLALRRLQELPLDALPEGQSNGHNILGLRAQLGYIQGFGGDVAPPQQRFYSGGENELRGFDVREATPYGYVPTASDVQLTNPDGSACRAIPTILS